MEAGHEPADAAFRPLDVTFTWKERQADWSLVERSHTERVTAVPLRYAIRVGGADHPALDSIRLAAAGGGPAPRPGYSDGRDAGGAKFVGRWETPGRNLADGKPYAVSVPSGSHWGSGDPEGRKLTDGVVGPPYPGGRAPTYGLSWDEKARPEITVDLGKVEACGAFRIALGAGWPWWDALKGEVKDRVEVLASTDGKEYASQGFFELNLRRKDIPWNHILPDDETLGGHLYALAPPRPVDARWVRFRIEPARILIVSEVQDLDGIRSVPFDLRVALPD
jgi:hypothetical protein